MNWQQILIGAALIAVALAGSSQARPTDATTGTGREGTVNHVGAGFPADYLAIPIGPGHRVTVCGPARCLSLTSTDAGPDREMLLAGRIADVSVPLFESLCGCPPSQGTFEGSWHVGPLVTPPSTDTAP